MSLRTRLTQLFARHRGTASRVVPAPPAELAVPPAEPPPALKIPARTPVIAPPIPQALPLGPEANHPAVAPASEDDASEDEAGGEDDEAVHEDDDLSGLGEPLQISRPTLASVAADRGEAERRALSGPQKVTLTDVAGPGSLAETLAGLEAQGRVRSELVEGDEIGPYILYTPV